MTTTERAIDDTLTRPAWSGVNHLALVTTDMDATVRFYHGVLGANLVATIGTPEFRHYFFEFGPQCTIAFFEYAGVALEPFAIAAGMPDARKVQFDHLSLNLPDEDALLELQRRLTEAGCEVTNVVDHNFIHSIYFSDPNGIALEASWWVRDVTEARGSFENENFVDADPVPALRELQATGRLASTGQPTHLT